MKTDRPRLLAPWRRSFQWFCSLLVLLIPFGRWHGRSLLRLDLDSFSLCFFGQILRLEDLHLFLFVCLLFLLLFLLATLVFGRVWCGWACPQTTLTDLAEWWARKIGLKIEHNRLQGPPARKAVAHAGFLLLSLLVGANLVWYFVEPERFFRQLADGTLHPGAWGGMLAIAGLVYVDLGFVRRLVCREFCPYGRFQTVLADRATLVLHRPASEAKRCIDCGACVRACPMGIDIRNGYQIECINCGRCLDACRQVMARRRQPGLMVYSFGSENLGARALLNPRTLLLVAATLGLAVVLAVSIHNRPLATLKLVPSHTAASRQLADGRTAIFFEGWLHNRDDREHSLNIEARDAAAVTSPELRGQTRNIRLQPGENRPVGFVLLTSPAKRQTIEFLLKDGQGTVLARQRLDLRPPSDR
ncbi:cytochrome c oxidase accessory protein FixG [Geothermobacter ehrlichii]|uniref:Cytochrome c oxidase accessory protein FixG n=1 Tax=Geothermobacter ehrlichii TaxID=213224 RepID=A0A5D3WK91_9BACT|nr:4Fe-4S dicluster domain-containing protein [Geothermobacter ehrlichii]TYO98774.1 cytochrome c oxidase accessory protein FixG [Geothermobacter ehrlichii]